ncbi:endo-1,4-beta-xylanase [bacterium]|nr:endo-1,4-beta-xylanase [candidate division CSSED10-310 bacterium]
MNHIRFYLGILTVFFSFDCVRNTVEQIEAGTGIEPSLRVYAERCGIGIGVAINSSSFKESIPQRLKYERIIRQEYNFMSDGFSLSMKHIWKSKDTIDFSPLDFSATFAQINNMPMRGFLIWGESVPAWLNSGGYTNEEIEAMTKSYIETVMKYCKKHFPDVVKYWDAVNEAMETNQDSLPYFQMKKNFWHEKLGPEYVSKVFRWAHESDSDVLLFYNEYGCEFQTPKKIATITFLSTLLQHSVPVHGIGLQCHFSIDTVRERMNLSEFARTIDQFTALGLHVHVTEFDVRINDDCSGLNQEKLLKQSQIFKNYFATYVDHCPSPLFTIFGVSDCATWIGSCTPFLPQKKDWPLPFDDNFLPKPSYDSLLAQLKQRADRFFLTVLRPDFH